MAMAYLKTNKYLTIKQYAKMTQLSRAAAEAELDACISKAHKDGISVKLICERYIISRI